MMPVIFARVGWMKWYRGPQTDDEKPIGGGSYNKQELGHEAFNFLSLNGALLGYFQPQLRKGYPSRIALDRIKAGFTGDALHGVLAVFVATDPKEGGQRIVGWYRDATVYRDDQQSSAKERREFSYFLKGQADKAVLIPEARRSFVIPGGRGRSVKPMFAMRWMVRGNQRTRRGSTMRWNTLIPTRSKTSRASLKAKPITISKRWSPSRSSMARAFRAIRGFAVRSKITPCKGLRNIWKG